MDRKEPELRRIAMVLLVAWPVVPAWATLGRGSGSIEADRVRLKASLRTTSMDGYVMHELRRPTGEAVREFGVAGGPVFGVAWEGPRLPDLRQLLGDHFDAYAQAARQARRRRGPLFVSLPELVVESSGHPRGFRGRAYVPAQLPAGVQADAIR